MAAKFELYQDNAGEYRFRLQHGNGENALASQGFKQRAAAENTISSVQKNAGDINRYERKQTATGKFMFNLKASNGEVIGTSQSYSSAKSRDEGIEKIIRVAATSSVNDLTYDWSRDRNSGSSHDDQSSQRDLSAEDKNTLPSDRFDRRGQAQKFVEDIENGVQEEARRSGFGLHFKRDSEELALNGQGFALAIARLFRNAEGEFSFALLGRWGSGKTTTARLVSAYLEAPSKYKDDFQKFFGSKTKDDCDNLKYRTVNFNAWRYRKKPELWVYLYESFLAEYLDCNIVERMAKTIRVNLLKIGVLQSFFTLFCIALSAFPLMWVSAFFPHAAAAFTVMGTVGLVLLGYRLRTSLRLLYDQYGVIKSHRDHLGMQAVIGYDLQVLLNSWSKTHHIKVWEKAVLGFGTILVSLVWLWVGYSTSSFSPASISGLVIWNILGGVFWASAYFKCGSVDRVLLVIDDLDRCPEEEIVDLIDGIKLMIDDETIGKVVQVLVLADDTVLDAAVRQRFKALSKINNEIRWIEAVSEHMEKVFLCHAHLPKLTQSNVGDLVGVYSAEFGVERAITELKGIIAELPETGSNEVEINSTESQRHLESGFVISVVERTAIQLSLEHAFSTANTPITPRFVRSFLYKYQLVRMLLQLNDVEFDTVELTKSLIDAVLCARSSESPWEPGVETQTTNFVRMVA